MVAFVSRSLRFGNLPKPIMFFSVNIGPRSGLFFIMFQFLSDNILNVRIAWVRVCDLDRGFNCCLFYYIQKFNLRILSSSFVVLSEGFFWVTPFEVVVDYFVSFWWKSSSYVKILLSRRNRPYSPLVLLGA